MHYFTFAYAHCIHNKKILLTLILLLNSKDITLHKMSSHFTNASHQTCLIQIFSSCIPEVVRYLCNYIPIFCVNLSYGTQLCQAAENLIQLNERQEEIISEQAAHGPGTPHGPSTHIPGSSRTQCSHARQSSGCAGTSSLKNAVTSSCSW